MDILNQISYISQHYTPALAVYKVLANTGTKLGNATHHYPKKIYTQSSKAVQQALVRKYHDFLAEWMKQHPVETAKPFNSQSAIPAWSCWLQGTQQMPPLIKEIHNAQVRSLSNYDLHIITEDNVNDYVELPDYIQEKIRNKTITPVHFTDLVRVCLLEQYGGLWIDATVLPTQIVPTSCVDFPWYTIKNLDMAFPKSQLYPEVAQWEGYYIAGQPHSLFYTWMKDFLFEYWKHEERLIHYLLVNQAALMAINEIPIIRKQYKEMPCTNHSCELLGPQLTNNSFSDITTLTHDGTYVFKLSRYGNYNATALESLFTQITKEQ